MLPLNSECALGNWGRNVGCPLGSASLRGTTLASWLSRAGVRQSSGNLKVREHPGRQLS
jgi:hypothetical protein